MDDLKLVRIAYVSAETEPFTHEAICKLLLKARQNNAEKGITGMLLYHQGSFLQLLEGEQSAVDELYDRISKDPRHFHVVKLLKEHIDERSFADWSMGYADSTDPFFNSVEGLNDFFEDQHCLKALRSVKARKLLKSFEEGQWHLKGRIQYANASSLRLQSRE
jgi:hypothetical protein